MSFVHREIPPPIASPYLPAGLRRDVRLRDRRDRVVAIARTGLLSGATCVLGIALGAAVAGGGRDVVPDPTARPAAATQGAPGAVPTTAPADVVAKATGAHARRPAPAATSRTRHTPRRSARATKVRKPPKPARPAVPTTKRVPGR